MPQPVEIPFEPFCGWRVLFMKSPSFIHQRAPLPPGGVFAFRCPVDADCYMVEQFSRGELMKVAIVLAGLVVVAVAAIVAIQPRFLKPASLAGVKKSDMFGFSPGMTSDETTKLITQRRYLCRQGRGSQPLECEINGAKVTV